MGVVRFQLDGAARAGPARGGLPGDLSSNGFAVVSPLALGVALPMASAAGMLRRLGRSRTGTTRATRRQKHSAYGEGADMSVAIFGRVTESVRDRGLRRVTFRVTPNAFLRGQAAGRFPYPQMNGSRLIPWFEPPQRAVIIVERVHVGATIRKRVRNRGWTTTVNAAFEEVIARCADRPRSPTTWITPALWQTFRQLHKRGRAYSLEVWDADGALIGGVFGVQSGGIFSAESLFHAADHASKVALVDLAVRIREAGGLAIDCQEPKQHTSAVGAELLNRAAYRALLRQAAPVTPHLEVVRLPTSRLADVDQGKLRSM